MIIRILWGQEQNSLRDWKLQEERRRGTERGREAERQRETERELKLNQSRMLAAICQEEGSGFNLEAHVVYWGSARVLLVKSPRDTLSKTGINSQGHFRA